MNPLRTIVEIFISPEIFITLKDEKGWWRGLLSLIVTMFLVYVAIFAVQLPNQIQKVSTWVSWFEGNIQSVDYDQKAQTLIYQTNHKLPYQTEKDDFSLVISDKNTIPIEKQKTPAGAILTPREITVWITQSDQKVIVPVVQKGKIMDNVKLEDFFKDTGVIKADFFASFAYATLLIYAFATVVSNLLYILLTTLLIIFVRRLINGKNDQYSFGNMFNLYCYIAIPPMALASIYSSLPNSFFEFSLTYMISLFVFITFVVRKPLLSTYKNKNSKEQ